MNVPGPIFHIENCNYPSQRTTTFFFTDACEHTFVKSIEQLRAIDESQSLISICTKCNYKKIEN